MRSRLAFAVAALFAVSALAVWGLLGSGGANSLAVPSGPAISYPAPVKPPAPPPLGPKSRLIFSASFSGSRLDTRVWDTCYPWRSGPGGCNNSSAAERQWYLPSQVSVSGGALRLTARPVVTAGLTKAGAPTQYPCRSGMVTSYPGFRFQYGYVKVVARMPSGPGLWSAIWMAAADFSWPPEMDVIEHWGLPDNRAGAFFHPLGAKTTGAVMHGADWSRLSSGWHTFSLNWTPTRMTWFADGREVFVITKRVPHQPMYLIANVADYDMSLPGSCSGEMAIRSVQVWQL